MEELGKSSTGAWIDADKKAAPVPAHETFADIRAADPTIRFLLDEDVWSVFDAMVTADVLVIDASKFPIVAGVYNPNTVIYNAIDLPRLAFPYGGYEKYILRHWIKIC